VPSSRNSGVGSALRPKLALATALAILLSACGGDRYEEQLGQIRALQDQGRADETLETLVELSRDRVDDPEVNYRLGLAMIAGGRLTEAVFPLHKAAENSEYAVPAGLLLASTLAKTGNHADALNAVAKVLEREPEHEAALLLRASSAVQLHDGALALEAAQKLVAKSPDNVNFAFVRAAALAETGRLDDAEAAYRDLLAADSASGDPQTLLRGCTSYARFLFEKRKDSDRAVASMKQCIEDHPDEVQLVAAVGGLLVEFDRRDELIPMIEDALERHPDSRRLREGLVAELVSAGRVDEAREHAEKWAGDATGARGWGQVATMRRRTGDLTGALEAIDRAIEISGGKPETDLLFARSELLLELGRVEEAERQAEAIEDTLQRKILEARFAQERGDNRRALDLYGEVSIQWPNNHVVRALAARAAYQLGDSERAKSDLLEATRQAPKETDAALWLAQIYFSEGNFRQCLAFTGRHIQERGVLDPAAHLLSAEALAASGRVEGALKVLGDLAALQDGRFRGPAWAAAARIRARTDPAQALAELEREIRTAGVDLAQLGLVETLVDLELRNGRAADAARRVDALASQHPDSPYLQALRGRVALAAGQRDAAAQAFARALALRADDPLALSGLALLQREQGDLAKATETMKKARDAAPENTDYAYMAARLVLEAGDRAAARREYEKVVIAHPDSAAAANDLAFLLAEESSDLAAAQRHAERAVRLQPSAETLDTLGFVKLRQGAAEEAVGLFERALARNAGYATARYHLALALIEKGEPVAARKALEEALAQPFPEQQEARNVLAKIDGGEARP
jgi:tetratricopeptide (TPR) repeat protein